MTKNVNSISNNPWPYNICDLESLGYVIDLYIGHWTTEPPVQNFLASKNSVTKVTIQIPKTVNMTT